MFEAICLQLNCKINNSEMKQSINLLPILKRDLGGGGRAT